MHTLYISLGSNLGNRREMIDRALTLIDERVGSVYLVSSYIETEPWGFESPHPFINAAARIHTMLSPRRCLEETQQIERELGRTQKSLDGHYHDRPIDIDLLIYDDLHIDEEYTIQGHTHRLTLPHPHMHERDFVMIPLREVMA